MFPILAIKCENRVIEGLIHNKTRNPVPDPTYMEETFVYPNWLGRLTEIPQERAFPKGQFMIGHLLKFTCI